MTTRQLFNRPVHGTVITMTPQNDVVQTTLAALQGAATALAAQGANITQLTAGLAANNTVDSQQAADIGGLRADVDANTAGVDQLTTDLAANVATDVAQAADITVLFANTDDMNNRVELAHEGLVANTAVDTQQTTDIAALQAGVATNTSSISQLTTDLVANTAVDSQQTADIAALQASVSSISQSGGNSATDAQQTADITALQADVANSNATLAQLSADLAANTANDHAQAVDIAALWSDVNDNTAGIAQLNTGLGANTAVDNQQTADIDNLQADVANNTAGLMQVANDLATIIPTIPPKMGVVELDVPAFNASHNVSWQPMPPMTMTDYGVSTSVTASGSTLHFQPGIYAININAGGVMNATNDYCEFIVRMRPDNAHNHIQELGGRAYKGNTSIGARVHNTILYYVTQQNQGLHHLEYYVANGTLGVSRFKIRIVRLTIV